MTEGRKYTGDDFFTHLSEIEVWTKTNYPSVYNSFKSADGGQFLFDLVAHVASGVSFVQNRKVLDQFLEDTRSKNIILKYANMFNYKPFNGSGASIDVNLTLDQAYVFPIPIEIGRESGGPDGSVWYIDGTNPVIILAGETEKTVTFRQGRLLNKFYTSNGEENQIFPITGLEEGEYIQPNSIVLRVDGEIWTEEEFLPFSSVNSYQADIFKDVPEIVFGNGIIGNIPPEDATIEISMRIHKGIESRVGDNFLSSFRVPVIVQGQTVGFTFNHNGSSGGFDPESLDSVRVNSHKFHSSQDRAVTKSDYNILSLRNEEVIMAHTETPRSIAEEFILNGFLDSLREKINSSSASANQKADLISVLDDTTEYLDETLSDTCKANTVMVYAMSVDQNNLYTSPSSLGMEQLRSSLQGKADAVHVVQVVSGTPNIIKVNMNVFVGISINANPQRMIKEIEDSLVKKTDDTEEGGSGFGILIRRNSGEHLFRHILYDRMVSSVTNRAGLISLNFQFSSDLDQYLDERGNLILPERRFVFEEGDVNVSQVFNESTRGQ